MRQSSTVIRCDKRHLIARCRERGYTLEEVMPCVIEAVGGEFVVDTAHPAYPAVSRKASAPKPGLGDMVSAGLAAVGITPERVSKVLGRPCGCKKRAAKLNELGKRIGIG